MSDTTLEENTHIQKKVFNAVLNSTLIGFLLLGTIHRHDLLTPWANYALHA